eukprot:1259673-Pyramimonas_sp.AAC.1
MVASSLGADAHWRASAAVESLEARCSAPQGHHRVGKGSVHSVILPRSIARSRCISRPGAALSDPEI